ncbi:MAG: hypothetical protein DRJ40_07045 [Thermoprotei archaeon]|nr:MAG: hypothetical protein DRJ40_07045 [Thermoprotei archaeon]
MYGRVTFKAVVTSKTLVTDITGTKYIRIELAEERELPGPIIVAEDKEASNLVREIAPVVRQVLRTLPTPFGAGKVMTPRLTIWLTEDEWEALPDKPDIGDEVEVVVEGTRITVRKA